MSAVTVQEVVEALRAYDKAMCECGYELAVDKTVADRIEAHGIAPPEGCVFMPAEWGFPTIRFSYKGNQPNNSYAWRMGEACSKAFKAPNGDYIDTGLALLRELEAAGFMLAAAPKQEND